MAELLKDRYSVGFIYRFAAVLNRHLNTFDEKDFIEMIFVPEWVAMELKQRMSHISKALGQCFSDFLHGVETIRNMIETIKADPFTTSSFEFLFLPDYVEHFGIDHYETAISAIENITQFVTCEFAVRPFLNKYGQPMMKQMQDWSLHPDWKVRRLSSEGMRPRLPWARAVPAVKKDPSPILPILERLKFDPSEVVRRSVANNLNDISKDWPDLAFEVASSWVGISPEVDAVAKHGCRTLLKSGHEGALVLFGHKADSRVHIHDFTIHTPQVANGEDLLFSFTIENTAFEPIFVRLEYGMDFLRQNGSWSRKVFKISERGLIPGEAIKIQRKQSFRPITTRVYYPGTQRVAVIVNGRELAVGEFVLLA